jgi:hypothetical protein
MKRTVRELLLIILALSIIAPNAALAIDRQAEIEHCKAVFENVAPLVRAGERVSAARGGSNLRRCLWLQRRLKRKTPAAS